MRGYKFILIGLLFVASGWFQLALAAPNVYVSTDINTTIIINVNVPEVGDSVTADVSAKGVTVVVGGTASAPQFTYTPPNNYSGADTFVYRVFSGVTELANAIVTVQVGPLSSASQSVVGTPEQVMLQQIDTMCSSVNGQAPASLTAFCSDFSIATPAERAKILREVAPLELGGQLQMSTAQASQQIDNVRRRLASLRQGIGGGGALSGLRLEWNKNSYAVNDILGRPVGGGAAADGNHKMSYFMNGSFGGTTHDESRYEDGYSLSNRAITLGVDYRVNDNLVAGAAFGSSHSGMDIDSSGGNVSTNGISLLAYSSFYLTSKSYVEGVWAMHKNSLDSTRNIDYSVQGQAQHASALSESDNAVFSISVGTGYEMYLKHGVTMNLSAAVDSVSSGFDGYAESGASDKNLVVSKREFTQTTYNLNAKLTKAVSFPSGVLLPQLDWTWKHDFNDKVQQIEARYRADPSKTLFTLYTEAPDSDYFQFNVGASYIVPGGNTGFLYYEKTLGKSGYSVYSMSLGIRWNL